MSSLVERLRVRSEKRPRYILDESDDDLPPHGGNGKGRERQDDAPAKQIEREGVQEDACRKCGLNDNLISCSTCTYAFHRKCLIPCLNITSDKWSCPECVSPLTEMEKILDCETPKVASEETGSPESGSKKKPVKQYLIKWKGLSHIHCTWVPEDEYLEAAKIHPRLKTRLNNFNRQFESIDRSDDDYVPITPEWTTVDRVLASRKNSTGEWEYYVKWKELSYEECTWENESDISVFQPQIDRYNDILSRHKQSTDKSKSANRYMCHVDRTPKFLSGGTLHPYQLEGLNFLRYSWSTNRRAILGDEMGLGKTIQSIAFLASVSEDKFGPHLVVAPLSTLRNWEREFATWAPQMNVLMYFGSSASRDIIKKHEFYYSKDKPKNLKKNKASSSNDEKKQSRIKFDVLLTTYEMINMDSAVLKTIDWECMVVDEGHRLKNKDSKFFGLLEDCHTQHRVLLTGTPVQNDLDELFMLMHFVEGETSGSISDLQEEFKDIDQDSQVEKLHWMLKPHLLQNGFREAGDPVVLQSKDRPRAMSKRSRSPRHSSSGSSSGHAGKRPSHDHQHRRQHLYVLLDDWKRGCGIYRVGEDDLKADSDGDIETPYAASPIARIEAPHHFSWTFTTHGTTILAVHQDEGSLAIPGFDTKTMGVTLCPFPESRASILRPFSVSLGERLFVMVGSSFEVLGPRPPPDSDKPWVWSCIDTEIPFSPEYITGYAVHPDGRTVFVSVKGWRPGDNARFLENLQQSTHSLDAKRLDFQYHGEWMLPFKGQAHYDSELDAWVGLPREETGHVCSCDVPSRASSDAMPCVKISEDKVFEPRSRRYRGATLVYMGRDSRYCLVQCYAHVDDAKLAYPSHRVMRMTTFSLKYGKNGELWTTHHRGRASISYKVPSELRVGSTLDPTAFWM